MGIRVSEGSSIYTTCSAFARRSLWNNLGRVSWPFPYGAASGSVACFAERRRKTRNAVEFARIFGHAHSRLSDFFGGEVASSIQLIYDEHSSRLHRKYFHCKGHGWKIHHPIQEEPRRGN